MFLTNLCRRSIPLLNKKWPHAIPSSWNKNKFHPRSSLNGLQERSVVTIPTMVVGATASTAVVAAGSFIASRVKIARPSQYVVKTGFAIDDIGVSKKTIRWPFQKAYFLNVEPETFRIEIKDAKSVERIPFVLPSVWTIGPEIEETALIKYARLLMDKGPEGLEETVSGIIHGEVRSLTALTKLDDLFNNRHIFKTNVVDKVNEIIKDFGLRIYNANIEELADLDEKNCYFSKQKERALQIVNEQARVDVSEAVKEGATGEKKQQTLQRQDVAKFEKEARVVENEREKEIAESDKDLAVAKAEYKQAEEIAKAEADAAAEKRTYELQKGVEETRKNQELEKVRADKWAEAKVAAEIALQKREAFETQAKADRFAKGQEALGILALREAEAKGLEKLARAAGGTEKLNQYLMVRDNILQELAKEQANALQGLKPNVTVWSTGSKENDSTFSSAMADVLKGVMPVFDIIKQQTGYDFLDSMGVKKDEPNSNSSEKKDDVKQSTEIQKVDEPDSNSLEKKDDVKQSTEIQTVDEPDSNSLEKGDDVKQSTEIQTVEEPNSNSLEKKDEDKQ